MGFFGPIVQPAAGRLARLVIEPCDGPDGGSEWLDVLRRRVDRPLRCERHAIAGDVDQRTGREIREVVEFPELRVGVGDAREEVQTGGRTPGKGKIEASAARAVGVRRRQTDGGRVLDLLIVPIEVEGRRIGHETPRA